MTLYLASTSPLKLEALKEVYNGDKEIQTCKAETQTPQPVGEKIKKLCLEERLAKVNKPNDCVIAIESYIRFGDDKNLYESCEVWMSENGRITVGKSSNDVLINPLMFHDYMSYNYETFGIYLLKRGLCRDHKNWTKDVVGVDRREIIKSALVNLFEQ